MASNDDYAPLNDQTPSDMANSFLHSMDQELTNPPSGERYDQYRDHRMHDPYAQASRSYDDRHYDRERRSRRERSRERVRSREHRDRRSDRDYRRGQRRSVSPRDRHRSSSRRHDADIIPLHKRTRRVNKWDIPPPGMEGMTAQQVKQTGMFPLPGQVLGTKTPQSFAPPTEFGYGNESAWQHGNREHHDRGPLPPISSAARQARRLYVGQIPPGIDERSAVGFFNDAMAELQGAAGSYVTSVQINHEKSYVFVEFHTPEQATAAMAFDGIIWNGQSVKVRRPKDYVPPVDGDSAGQPQTNAAVPDSTDKIFIGGLPTYLTDDQVKELLQSFGELKAFNLVKEATGQSKGYAFCEYLDPNVTDLACQGLNQMEVGEKKLIVQRASVGAKQGAITGANAIAVEPRSLVTDLPLTGANDDDVTVVLQLMNMVVPDELEDDEEYQDIWDDVAEECGKFGEMVDMKIPRPSKDRAVPGCGSIFVRYKSIDYAKTALQALAGRKFADRTVVASYIDEESYINDY
ncbi:hypothetical protein BC940DRAFT_313471 [Gongronella butleri]|nr:hypothetical protein BC940DRAFT_313471 [Gongronella butleri]